MDGPAPVALKSDGEALVITWNDGAVHRLPWRLLRACCPCANCRNPQPPPSQDLLPILRPEEARPLQVLGMQPVGHYAYTIHFSDGHNTGIYSLRYLRQLGEESAGRGG